MKTMKRRRIHKMEVRYGENEKGTPDGAPNSLG